MKTTEQQVVEWSEMVGGIFRFLESLGYVRQAPQLSVTSGSATYLGPKLGVRLEIEIDRVFIFVALFRMGHPEHQASAYLRSCLK